MQYAICIVSAAPVRKEAAHRSEMISQVLFGETMEVLEQSKEWYKVRCLYDGYEGWLTDHLISLIDKEVATAPNNFVSTGLLNTVSFGNEPINVAMGSSLTGLNEETLLLWNDHYQYNGLYRNTQMPYTEELFWQTIKPWMNAPYLWGGRTFMGVDCSGFVQTVYKVLGIALLRDAYQQAEQGSAVADVHSALMGDVAFFHNEAGKITHVGIVLPGNKIIHASGKVRIDNLTKDGIFIEETGRQTHHLHSIKRFLQFY
jgi:gamma-D-glutamyl-L-lysine dipeptidyl-peptidase